MSTALALKQDWTPDQLKLITATIAKDATPDELKLFLYRCKNMGLDPLKPGQIHFVKYNANSVGTIVVGIEGFRSIAARTGKLSGVSRGVVRDEKGKVVAAWAEVHRKDWDKPAREEVPLAEYNTGKGPWAKMPETMLKKVAEAAALRMAFPDDLGGVYESAEMDLAVKPAVGGKYVVPQQPEEGDGFEPHDNSGVYKKDFGQWRFKTIEQMYDDPAIGPDRIIAYIAYLEREIEKSGKPMGEQVKRFIAEAEKFLGQKENGDAQE